MEEFDNSFKNEILVARQLLKHQCQKENYKDQDKHNFDKFLSFFDGECASDIATQDVGQRDGDADAVEDFVGQDKGHEGADIGCQVEDLGDGGGIDQVQAQEGVESED